MPWHALVVLYRTAKGGAQAVHWGLCIMGAGRGDLHSIRDHVVYAGGAPVAYLVVCSLHHVWMGETSVATGKLEIEQSCLNGYKQQDFIMSQLRKGPRTSSIIDSPKELAEIVSLHNSVAPYFGSKLGC